MVILALRCVVQDHRHRSLIHFVRRPMAGLARQQHPDGSFGGLATTALAIQVKKRAYSSVLLVPLIIPGKKCIRHALIPGVRWPPRPMK